MKHFLIAAVSSAILAIAPMLSPAKAEIVANLGVLGPGAEAVACNQLNCLASQGTSGGSLPAAGTFTHQIVFQVSSLSATISSTQILDSTQFDIADVSIGLYQLAGGSLTGVGQNATLGALLAAAVGPFGIPPTANFLLAYTGLNPGINYAIQILGGDQGVIGSQASYAQQILVNPVPLPAAVWLLAAACAGLAGFARIKANRNKHAAV